MSPGVSQKMAGPAGKTAERARYLELTRQGLSNAEICRQLGIQRKTGSRWRNGRRDRDLAGVVRSYPALVQVRAPTVSARFLSEEERVRIADLVKAGYSMRHVAMTLGRAPSTISRELRRNLNATGAYRPFHTHKLAWNRRTRPRPSKFAATPHLRAEVQSLLSKRWSPEQISRHLRRQYPKDPCRRVVHETIYRDLYDWQGGSLERGSFRMLRTKRDRRKPSRLIPRRRSRFGSNVLKISARPFPPGDRTVAGAWEGDLIMGRHNRSAIGTLVERTTRFTILLHVDAARRSVTTRDALVTALGALPAQLRTSITWDQGWELALHEQITAALGTAIHFCDPHSPWQRGTNENTSRLLRDYFPKRTDLGIHTPQGLADVAAELNDRPREALNGDTPASRFTTLLSTYQ